MYTHVLVPPCLTDGEQFLTCYTHFSHRYLNRPSIFCRTKVSHQLMHGWRGNILQLIQILCCTRLIAALYTAYQDCIPSINHKGHDKTSTSGVCLPPGYNKGRLLYMYFAWKCQLKHCLIQESKLYLYLKTWYMNRTTS